MAIKIGANFAYNGKLPNFERDSFKTKAAMKAFAENNIDEGHLSYCEEDGIIYQYKSTNIADATVGRWRPYKPVEALLNGTSTNAIQTKSVFEALKLKADAAALDKYQPKYNAAYIAKEDLENLIELPIADGVLDLNGHELYMPNVKDGGDLVIINGTIHFNKDIRFENNSLTLNNVIIKGGGADVTLILDFLNLFNVTNGSNNSVNFLTSDAVIRELNLYNSSISSSLLVSEKCGVYNSFCSLCLSSSENTSLLLTAYNSVILDDGLSDLSIGSEWYNTYIDIEDYINGYIDKDGVHNRTSYADVLNDTETNAPQTNAVYNALQLKADKTQLNDYLTKTNASTTYATKDSLNNEVNQLVEEINLKLDDTVAASTYLRQDDANTTYAKKTDITNIYKFKGTKTNYAELPTTGVITGDVWNITNADATHGIKAGDNVAWNGTAWDNLSGVTDLSAYATTTTTDAISADVKKLMDKAFPFTVKVSLDKTLAKKGTSQAVKVTITPKIGDDNTNVDEIMINGAEYHGATPYVYSDTATATTTYNVRVSKDSRSAQGSATITFVNPSYDGAVAANFTATEANIKTLTEAVRSGKGGTRTFNLNNQKACIAYPKAFGAATSIKDANGFDYLASYTRSELSVNGELYYVYLLTNATTITDMKQTVS